MKRKRDSGSPESNDPKPGHSRDGDHRHHHIHSRLSSTFSVKEIKGVIYDTLRKNLRGRRYDNKYADDWSSKISHDIRNELVNCGLDRYKIVCQVILGETRGACLKNSAGCFWDQDRDRLASEEYTGNEIFSTATVFGCYNYSKE